MKNLDFFTFSSNNDIRYYLGLDSYLMFSYESDDIFTFDVFFDGDSIIKGRVKFTSFIQILYIDYTDFRFIRFLYNEISRFEPLLIAKFRSVQTFFPTLLRLLSSVISELFFSKYVCQ